MGCDSLVMVMVVMDDEVDTSKHESKQIIRNKCDLYFFLPVGGCTWKSRAEEGEHLEEH